MRLLCFLALAAGHLAAAPLQLGANFNEHLAAAKPELLKAGNPGWVRGFLPASGFLSGRKKLTDDPGVKAFLAAREDGRKIAITIKWDFQKKHIRVPAPDSPREKECFDFATRVASELRPDLFLLVNEVHIDTMPEDMKPGGDGTIPMVRFLQRLTTHVHSLKDNLGGDGPPLRLSCGGFTRMDQRRMREHPANLALLEWLAATKELDAVNFHLHHNNLEEFEEALSFVRGKVPEKPFVITEFSIVWHYKRQLARPIGASPAGKRFAETRGMSPETTVRDFLNDCVRKPVPESVMHDFLASQPWDDPQFLRKSCELMEKHGVILATFAYAQGASGNARPMKADGTPWILNPIFFNALATSDDPSRPATRPGFYQEFRRRNP